MCSTRRETVAAFHVPSCVGPPGKNSAVLTKSDRNKDSDAWMGLSKELLSLRGAVPGGAGDITTDDTAAPAEEDMLVVVVVVVVVTVVVFELVAAVEGGVAVLVKVAGEVGCPDGCLLRMEAPGRLQLAVNCSERSRLMSLLPELVLLVLFEERVEAEKLIAVSKTL